ncbi:hypothetical protein CS0771_39390 [Catellatospora sp. IY07-71]|nr:hypothetical protein CS0771_39390 [Catellatospora sp. IY07-71]
MRELYTALPEEFVAARDAAAAAAKAAGHGPQATAIKRLRRPTVAAWLVNLLAHRAPERITELAELGTELREAQRRLRGDELRALTVRRRELLSALADDAEQLAVKAQPSLSPARLPRAEVEETLAAALADEDVAAQIRAGTVVKAVSYTGFGTALPPVDESAEAEARRAPTPRVERRLRAVPAPEPAPTDEEVRVPEPPRVPAGLRRALDAAEEAEGRARAELDAAREAEQAAGAELAEVRAAMSALEERRDRAQQEANRRRAARTAAERALAAAVRRTAREQAAIDAHGG